MLAEPGSTAALPPAERLRRSVARAGPSEGLDAGRGPGSLCGEGPGSACGWAQGGETPSFLLIRTHELCVIQDTTWCNAYGPQVWVDLRCISDAAW